MALAHQIGGAAGTYPGGLIYETVGEYGAAFVFMAVVALFGAVFSLEIKKVTLQARGSVRS